MSEPLQVGILTAGSGLIGVLLGILGTLYIEHRKRLSEERRWYADFFLGRKVDALHNLYATLVDCHFALNHYANAPPSTLKEYEEKVMAPVQAFFRAKVMSSLFLDDEAESIMSKALGTHRATKMGIFSRLPEGEYPFKPMPSDDDIQIPWDKFMGTYKDAVACLREMLNPAVLEGVKEAK